MFIFPDMLGEAEFKEFTASDYIALSKVLDDVLCNYLKSYCSNPEADPYIVDCIQNFLGSTVESMTLHYVLKERNIIDLVQHLSPVNLLDVQEDFPRILEDLRFLDANADKLILHISGRTKEAWDNFYTSMAAVISRMEAKGIPTSVPNLLKILEANRFVFYKPNDKGHSTYTDVVFKNRRQWTMCLRGIEYIQYCNDNNIDYSKRRLF